MRSVAALERSMLHGRSAAGGDPSLTAPTCTGEPRSLFARRLGFDVRSVVQQLVHQAELLCGTKRQSADWV